MQCLHMDPANEDVGKELDSMCLMLLANLLCIICKCMKVYFILVPSDLSINSEMCIFNSQDSIYCINDEERNKGPVLRLPLFHRKR